MKKRIAASGMLVLAAVIAPFDRAQSQPPVAAPKFEVASVRPSTNCSDGRNGTGERIDWSPGRLRLECQAVEDLIRWAYLGYENGKPWPIDSKTGSKVSPVPERLLYQPIQGSPAWFKSQRYEIDAKAVEPVGQEIMRGPMMQALLEDRFKLKLHRESREVPVYALTVAKGGPKLQPTKEGSCSTTDFTKGPPAPREPGQPPPCGFNAFSSTGGMKTYGETMAELARQLSAPLDRDVVDQTGIAGVFDIHLDLSAADLFPGRPDVSPAVSDPAAPQIPADPLGAIMNAVQKLGLRLEPAKGTGEFLVIDSVDRPSEN